MIHMDNLTVSLSSTDGLSVWQGVETPNMDKIIRWFEELMDKDVRVAFVGLHENRF